MRIVIAPDKFKGSLPAVEVAAALAAGLRGTGAELVTVPVADGGDGTVDAAVAAGFTRVPVTATGPTGQPVATAYARRDDLALVELATVCGLERLPGGQLEPLISSSYGVGEVMRRALAAGARELVLALGGSASTDGGAGMLQALGARVLGGRGEPLGPGGGALGAVTELDLTALVQSGLVQSGPVMSGPVMSGRDLSARDLSGPGMSGRELSGPDPAATAQITLAADVQNPLTGPDGAAAVFGPQKGATPEQVARLDDALRRWAGLVAGATGRDWSQAPGAGAAGGVGFAALAVLGAQQRSGIDLILDLVGFDAALAGADLVITGEGSLDTQSLAGKAPVGVARAAARRGIPVVAVAGRSTLTTEQARAAGISAIHSLSALEPDLARSMAGAAGLLERVARDQLAPWSRT
ncbi:MAG TPA: glycerate kinase [Streptosporangiaceae bacterium]|jgi:glycerate kinase